MMKSISLDHMIRLSLILYLFIYAGCNNDQNRDMDLAENTMPSVESDNTLPSAVYNTTWTLKMLNGRDLTGQNYAKTAPTLQFESPGASINGSGGCNMFQGKYITESDRLEFDDIAATKMACPDLDLEVEFFDALRSTIRFSLSRDEAELTLKDASETVVMVFYSSES